MSFHLLGAVLITCDVLDVCLLAGLPTIQTVTVMFADVVMVLIGLFAALQGASEKSRWFLYAVSCAVSRARFRDASTEGSPRSLVLLGRPLHARRLRPPGRIPAVLVGQANLQRHRRHDYCPLDRIPHRLCLDRGKRQDQCGCRGYCVWCFGCRKYLSERL